MKKSNAPTEQNKRKRRKTPSTSETDEPRVTRSTKGYPTVRKRGRPPKKVVQSEEATAVSLDANEETSVPYSSTMAYIPCHSTQQKCLGAQIHDLLKAPQLKQFDKFSQGLYSIDQAEDCLARVFDQEESADEVLMQKIEGAATQEAVIAAHAQLHGHLRIARNLEHDLGVLESFTSWIHQLRVNSGCEENYEELIDVTSAPVQGYSKFIEGLRKFIDIAKSLVASKRSPSKSNDNYNRGVAILNATIRKAELLASASNTNRLLNLSRRLSAQCTEAPPKKKRKKRDPKAKAKDTATVVKKMPPEQMPPPDETPTKTRTRNLLRHSDKRAKSTGVASRLELEGGNRTSSGSDATDRARSEENLHEIGIPTWTGDTYKMASGNVYQIGNPKALSVKLFDKVKGYPAVCFDDGTFTVGDNRYLMRNSIKLPDDMVIFDRDIAMKVEKRQKTPAMLCSQKKKQPVTGEVQDDFTGTTGQSFDLDSCAVPGGMHSTPAVASNDQQHSRVPQAGQTGNFLPAQEFVADIAGRLFSNRMTIDEACTTLNQCASLSLSLVNYIGPRKVPEPCRTSLENVCSLLGTIPVSVSRPQQQPKQSLDEEIFKTLSEIPGSVVGEDPYSQLDISMFQVPSGGLAISNLGWRNALSLHIAIMQRVRQEDLMAQRKLDQAIVECMVTNKDPNAWRTKGRFVELFLVDPEWFCDELQKFLVAKVGEKKKIKEESLFQNANLHINTKLMYWFCSEAWFGPESNCRNYRVVYKHAFFHKFPHMIGKIYQSTSHRHSLLPPWQQNWLVSHVRKPSGTVFVKTKPPLKSRELYRDVKRLYKLFSKYGTESAKARKKMTPAEIDIVTYMTTMPTRDEYERGFERLNEMMSHRLWPGRKQDIIDMSGDTTGEELQKETEDSSESDGSSSNEDLDDT